jgi:hypothetical protein
VAGKWSRLECELIVEDYLEMLAKESRFEKYSKTEHRRALREKLHGRSDGSIEYKHQNISAVLIRAGMVYVRGYKPAWNYQELLEAVVMDRLSSADGSIIEIETSIIEQAAEVPEVDNSASFLVDPPEQNSERKVREPTTRVPRHVDYAERELRNSTLGKKGEEFVLGFERRRLDEVGRADLIPDVEWTSQDKGDGTGYDIRSFRDNTDEPLYVEVKTTNSGKYQPFMISSNEVSFSDENSENFALYRVFEFSRSPKLYMLKGAVASHVDLSPAVFRASV